MLVVGTPRPAAIGAGFARLATGRGSIRPAGVFGIASQGPARCPLSPPADARTRTPGSGPGVWLHIFCGLLQGPARSWRPASGLPQAKPQVRRMMINWLIDRMTLEAPRTTPKGAESICNRATNRKKRARNRFPPTRPPRTASTLRVSVACRRLRVAGERAGALGRRPRAEPKRRRRRPTARHPAGRHARTKGSTDRAPSKRKGLRFGQKFHFGAAPWSKIPLWRRRARDLRRILLYKSNRHLGFCRSRSAAST